MGNDHFDNELGNWLHCKRLWPAGNTKKVSSCWYWDRNCQIVELKFTVDMYHWSIKLIVTVFQIVNSTKEKDSSVPEGSSIPEETKAFDIASEIAQLVENTVTGLDLFEEMFFFISGFDSELRDEISWLLLWVRPIIPNKSTRKLGGLIRDNGGFVFDKISSSVTHIIANKDDLENNPDLKSGHQTNDCSIVAFTWVLPD